MPDDPWLLITPADYLAHPGVRRVLDCVPGEGHVTLVLEPGYEGLAERLRQQGRTSPGLMIHEQVEEA
jgi:hypothetical protein